MGIFVDRLPNKAAEDWSNDDVLIRLYGIITVLKNWNMSPFAYLGLIFMFLSIPDWSRKAVSLGIIRSAEQSFFGEIVEIGANVKDLLIKQRIVHQAN